MSEARYEKIDCYLCGGSVEFPPELANRVIECPHCQQKIKLFVEGNSERSVMRIVWWPEYRFRFNKKQKCLTALAILIFVMTICDAPWHASGTDHFMNQELEGPIFNPPYAYGATNLRLRVEVLLVEWLAISVVYTGLLFLLRTRPAKAKPQAEV